MRSRTFIMRPRSTCQHCGIARAFIETEAAEILDQWLQEKDYGTLFDNLREGREVNGGYTFSHGGGYALTDDILGGSGGSRERELYHDLDVYLQFSYGGRMTSCRECSRALRG